MRTGIKRQGSVLSTLAERWDLLEFSPRRISQQATDKSLKIQQPSVNSTCMAGHSSRCQCGTAAQVFFLVETALNNFMWDLQCFQAYQVQFLAAAQYWGVPSDLASGPCGPCKSINDTINACLRVHLQNWMAQG